jgi:hypothetical protein
MGIRSGNRFSSPVAPNNNNEAVIRVALAAFIFRPSDVRTL